MAGKLVDCIGEPRGYDRRQRFAYPEFGGAGIDRGGNRAGLEEAEQRPQLMFDNQRMTKAAAERGQQHRAVLQRARLDQVEHMLEQAGIGALEHRAADDETISALYRLDHGTSAAAQPVARK